MKHLFLIILLMLMVSCRTTKKLNKTLDTSNIIKVDSMTTYKVDTINMGIIMLSKKGVVEEKITETIYDTVRINNQIQSFPKSSKTKFKSLSYSNDSVTSIVNKTSLNKTSDTHKDIVNEEKIKEYTKYNIKKNTLDKILLKIIGFLIVYILLKKYFPKTIKRLFK